MDKLEVRVISDTADKFAWVIVDHIWDSISAPIAMGSQTYATHAEAMLAGVAELREIESNPARDRPLKD